MRNLARSQAFAVQQRTDALAQLLRGCVDHPRRNLFAPDL
jgi:hypothetical protein